MLHELWTKAPAKRSPEDRRFGLVSFVDILGFASIAWTVPANELREKLQYALNFSRSASGHPPTAGSPPREFVKFQDTMIRCTEIGWADKAESDTSHHLAKWYFAILDEVASLRDVQLNFVGEGVLLRGAVALGLYDVVEGTVFGPALLRALDGEKTVARFPRIVLEETIGGFIDIASPHASWFKLNVRRNGKNVPFIDYLRGAAFEAPWDLWWYAKALERHKFSLDRLTASRPEDPEAAAKLTWLVDYHNETVQHLSNTAPRAWELDWPTFLCNPSWKG